MSIGRGGGAAEKIRVLYVFAALPVGGAEELLVTEVEGLDRNLFFPLVCAISEKGPVGEEIEKMGVPIIPLHLMRSSRLDHRIIPRLWRLMGEEKVQVVHTHLYDGSKYGRIAAKLARVPCIVSTYHNVYVRRRIKHHLINRALSAITDRVVAVSGAVKESLVRFDRIRPQRIQVIYNGIDPERFAGPFDTSAVRERFGIGPEDFLVGVAARLEEQKGHVFLFEALRRIAPAFPQLKVLILGGGKLRSFLEERCRALELSGCVVFAGIQKPMPPILAALDLFLLPSLWEGFSIALLEAMAAGRPVVATRVGGAAEVITSGVDGLLIPPGDIRSIARAIEDVLLRPEEFREMGRRGREKVIGNFSQARHISQLQSLYLEILKNKTGSLLKKSI